MFSLIVFLLLYLTFCFQLVFLKYMYWSACRADVTNIGGTQAGFREQAHEGVANSTSKNVGLGKFWQDLEISEAFLISLEVSFFHGLLLLFLSLETFHQRVSGSDF